MEKFTSQVQEAGCGQRINCIKLTVQYKQSFI